MQKIRSNLKKSLSDTWLMGYVDGVLNYAKSDAKFASSLAYHIQRQNWKQYSLNTVPGSVSYLVPDNRTEAVASAVWLLRTLNTKTSARDSRGVLTTWAKDFESPKDVIFGIVGLAIIGPTLGIINKKRKHQAHLQVVINKKIYDSLTKLQVAEISQRLSVDIIAKELRLAGGNAYDLHPDSAEWFFVEPATKFFTDSETNLLELAKVARTGGLSHSVQTNQKGKIVAIALSPSVNDSFINESEAQILS